jgi:DNA polymerase-1
MGFFRACGWPMPVNVFDCFAEFHEQCNGLRGEKGQPQAYWGLLDACELAGLTHIDKETKDRMRDLVLREKPYSEAERADILTYCQSDVSETSELFEKLFPVVNIEEALRRGRYMGGAVSAMEWTGVPIDVPMFVSFERNWTTLKAGLIADVDTSYDVYDGLSFRKKWFAEYLDAQGWLQSWPRAPKGSLSTSGKTFEKFELIHPELKPLGDLTAALNKMKGTGLTVGSDGRNRTMLSPFGTNTGRNTPSNAHFIFGFSAWMRGLIRPEEGYALAYLDYAKQEFGIAAALSGDPVMWQDYLSGDPYVLLGKYSGLIKPEWTKETHPVEWDIQRGLCKNGVLGMNYGQQAEGLAQRLGVAVGTATTIIEACHARYSVYWAWIRNVVSEAFEDGFISTKFGWRKRVSTSSNPRALLNFPMQAHGAEMMRLSSCLVTESGIDVCCPVHDALLIYGQASQIKVLATVTQMLMGEASRDVLGEGFTIATPRSSVIRIDIWMEEGRIFGVV